MPIQGNIIVCKSKKFALEIISIYNFLRCNKHEDIMAKQLLRSGTSIGANVKEAVRGQSKADFFAKCAFKIARALENVSFLWYNEKCSSKP